MTFVCVTNCLTKYCHCSWISAKKLVAKLFHYHTSSEYWTSGYDSSSWWEWGSLLVQLNPLIVQNAYSSAISNQLNTLSQQAWAWLWHFRAWQNYFTIITRWRSEIFLQSAWFKASIISELPTHTTYFPTFLPSLLHYPTTTLPSQPHYPLHYPIHYRATIPPPHYTTLPTILLSPLHYTTLPIKG